MAAGAVAKVSLIFWGIGIVSGFPDPIGGSKTGRTRLWDVGTAAGASSSDSTIWRL